MVRDISGKHSGYFEAVLQLREISNQIYQTAKTELRDAKIHLAKEKKLKNGYDLYLGDSKYAQKIGKKLQKEFGGEVKITASLFGQQDGKEIYRVTVLFRGVSFKKGNLVEFEGEKYTVVYMAKNDLLLQKEEGGEKIHLKYKEINKIKAVS